MTGAARIAIIAGQGQLPALIAAALPEPPFVAALDGFAPHGLAVGQVFRIERLALLLRQMDDAGIRCVLFAGAVKRPRLDPALFDPQTAQLVPRLLGAVQAGDDALLRAVIGIFEDAGFTVVGVRDVAPDLVPGPGVLAGAPAEADARDADRAAAIVAALGPLDVGQGAVVARGLCLAVEALPGTDAMLDFVAAHAGGAEVSRGLLYKAPKPGQDPRVDLPTLGPATLRRVAAAGLAGIAWQAGGVILIDRAAMIALAAELGLFLWARPE